jgi:hypothetical protein
MNRIRVFLVLLASTLLIAGCAAPMQPAPPSPPDAGGTAPNLMPPAPASGPCRMSRNADAPVICVDDSADVLRVSHDPFYLHETPSPAANAAPAVQWFTTSGKGDLRIVFRDERCVRNVTCRGGRCSAVPSKLDPGEKERRCKYDVQLTGHPDLDPEGVLTGCCLPPEGGS